MTITITAYRTEGWTPDWAIEPAPATRQWMGAAPEKHPYRCLPMTIANSAGWVIRCPATFMAAWNGAPARDALQLHFHDEYRTRYARSITSHFGSGVLTFQVPYLFRTTGCSALCVRGLPNYPKQNATPLEGIVETGWLDFTFTMNWLLYPMQAALFEAGDPICFIHPIHSLDDLTTIKPVIADMPDDIRASYMEYNRDRARFNADPKRQPEEWQKTYTKEAATKALKLHPFAPLEAPA